jgi:hypothetical protein
MAHYRRAAESAQSIVYTSRWGEVLVVERRARMPASIYIAPGDEASELLHDLEHAPDGEAVDTILEEMLDGIDPVRETLPQEVLEDLRRV